MGVFFTTIADIYLYQLFDKHNYEFQNMEGDTKPIYELDAKQVFLISGSALLVTGFRNPFLPCFDYNFLHPQEIFLRLKNHIIVYNSYILNS